MVILIISKSDLIPVAVHVNVTDSYRSFDSVLNVCGVRDYVMCVK